VVFEVYPNLKRLMATLGGCRVVARGEPLPECDYCIALMALPDALGAQLQHIVAPAKFIRRLEM
jgi:hypothetical protein